MQRMFSRRLGYPCSRFDDTYSRLDRSFRFAGPNTAAARALEDRLRLVTGVSEGDARLLTSCAFPFDGDQTDFHPDLDWFVSEDRDLIAAMSSAATSAFVELSHLRIGSVADIVAAYPAVF